MNFKFIANACGILEGSKGTKILFDPWIENGVFEGSWFHFPPLKTRFKDINKVDAIYISHLHPDHFDIRTFRKFNKKTPILILDRKLNFLSNILTNEGFFNQIKIKNFEKSTFKEFEITMLEPFEKHNFEDSDLGNLIDSSIIIKDTIKNKVLVNFNDNIPSIKSAIKIKKKFKNIDLALVNYNSAGPYPSCFENLNENEKKIECDRIKKRNLNHTLKIVETLKPKSVLPFAGSYILAGTNYFKNKFLANMSVKFCCKFLENNIKFETKILNLYEGQKIFLKNFNIIGKKNILSNQKRKYYEKILKNVKYDYQLDKNPNQKKLKKDIEKSKINLNNKIKKLNIKIKSNIFLELNKKKIKIVNGKNNDKIICRLDNKLLRRILDKKAHWNNAEIGAHISFNRQPNKADIDAHTCMSFFHL